MPPSVPRRLADHFACTSLLLAALWFAVRWPRLRHRTTA